MCVPLKIVFLSNHFIPSIGGVELSVHNTAQALVDKGHEVTIVTETQANENGSEDSSYSIIRFSVPLRRPFTRLWYWKQMWLLRHTFKTADVIHFHDYITLIHWYLPLRFMILKPVYAITFHGYEGYPVLFRHQLFRLLASMLTEIRLGVGKYLSKLYVHPFDDWYIGAPVRTVKKRDIGNPIFRFVYIGRFETDSQITEWLPQIISYADINQTPVEVVLVGKGSLEKDLFDCNTEYCAVSLVQSTVDIAPYYESASIIVGTGFLSILDGLVSGIPVIIPAYTGLKMEYVHSIPNIQDMAFIVRNEKELHSAIKQCYVMTTIAKEKAEKAVLYSASLKWSDVADTYISYYNQHCDISRIRADHKLAEHSS